MSHKFSAARRAAFLRAVEETGNQTLAAERAKVSRSWVGMTRAAEPAFDAAVRAAVGVARGRLSAGAKKQEGAVTGSAKSVEPAEDGSGGMALTPPSGWGHQHGVELVVRGSNGRRVQVARARVKQWTPRVEARFLAVLAASCNVKAACAAVQLSQASAYGHRLRHKTFATAWDEAVSIGYDRIEAAMLAQAQQSVSGRSFDPDLPIPAMSFDQAITLLHLHRQQTRGVGGAPGRAPTQRAWEDTQQRLAKSLARKLRVLEAQAAERGG